MDDDDDISGLDGGNETGGDKLIPLENCLMMMMMMVMASMEETCSAVM